MQRVLRITNRKHEQSTCEHRKHQEYKQWRNRKKWIENCFIDETKIMIKE